MPTIKRLLHSSNMQKQKLHPFCNRSSPDDDPKSSRKYLGYIQLEKIHQTFPDEYDKSSTAIRTDPEENMYTENVYYVQRNFYKYIYLYIYIYRQMESWWIVLFYGISTFSRCPWCNCYRRRKWTRRHEFKSWTRLIAFHIALIPLGKVWIQLFSLQLWVNSRKDYVLQPRWGN